MAFGVGVGCGVVGCVPSVFLVPLSNNEEKREGVSPVFGCFRVLGVKRFQKDRSTLRFQKSPRNIPLTLEWLSSRRVSMSSYHLPGRCSEHFQASWYEVTLMEQSKVTEWLCNIMIASKTPGISRVTSVFFILKRGLVAGSPWQLPEGGSGSSPERP